MHFECFEYCTNLLVNMRFFLGGDSGLGKILALRGFRPWEDSGLGKILALGRLWP